MRIAVTGGAGFIGSAVCRYLVGTLGHEVVNIDKLTYAANLASLESIAGSNAYTFAQIDICDRSALDEILATTAPDAIIHLAAESHVDRSITGAGDFIQTNVVGTYQLLEAARAYWSDLPEDRRSSFRLLHVSTDEVYGSLAMDDGLFSEETRYDPSSPYSASKAASDHVAIAWYRTYGLPVIISNCSNNYGPYHFPEKLIPLMIINAIEGKRLPVYGDGSNVRDWLYVDDHARALFLALTKGRPGEKYNIGGHNERSNLEVVERICTFLDAAVPTGRPHRDLIEFVTDRPGHDARYAIDPAKAQNELGWRAEESFESGLEKTVRWFLANEAWWRPLREDRYAGDRLGLPVAAGT